MANKLKLEINPDKARSCRDPDKILADALAERALFLQKYPKYLPFQRDIDALLDKAGNAENRMTVLAVLMEAKLIELHGQLKSLNAILVSTGAVPVRDLRFTGPH
jgi:hypothetical protein